MQNEEKNTIIKSYVLKLS